MATSSRVLDDDEVRFDDNGEDASEADAYRRRYSRFLQRRSDARLSTQSLVDLGKTQLVDEERLTQSFASRPLTVGKNERYVVAKDTRPAQEEIKALIRENAESIKQRSLQQADLDRLRQEVDDIDVTYVLTHSSARHWWTKYVGTQRIKIDQDYFEKCIAMEFFDIFDALSETNHAKLMDKIFEKLANQEPAFVSIGALEIFSRKDGLRESIQHVFDSLFPSMNNRVKSVEQQSFNFTFADSAANRSMNRSPVREAALGSIVGSSVASEVLQSALQQPSFPRMAVSNPIIPVSTVGNGAPKGTLVGTRQPESSRYGIESPSSHQNHNHHIALTQDMNRVVTPVQPSVPEIPPFSPYEPPSESKPDSASTDDLHRTLHFLEQQSYFQVNGESAHANRTVLPATPQIPSVTVSKIPPMERPLQGWELIRESSELISEELSGIRLMLKSKEDQLKKREDALTQKEIQFLEQAIQFKTQIAKEVEAAVEQTSGKLKREMSKLNSRFESIHHRTREQSELISKLRQENDRLNHELHQLQDKHKTLKTRFADVSRLTDSYKNKVVDLEKEMKQLTAENDSLKKKNVKWKKKCEDTDAQLLRLSALQNRSATAAEDETVSISDNNHRRRELTSVDSNVELAESNDKPSSSSAVRRLVNQSKPKGQASTNSIHKTGSATRSHLSPTKTIGSKADSISGLLFGLLQSIHRIAVRSSSSNDCSALRNLQLSSDYIWEVLASIYQPMKSELVSALLDPLVIRLWATVPCPLELKERVLEVCYSLSVQELASQLNSTNSAQHQLPIHRWDNADSAQNRLLNLLCGSAGVDKPASQSTSSRKLTQVDLKGIDMKNHQITHESSHRDNLSITKADLTHSESMRLLVQLLILLLSGQVHVINNALSELRHELASSLRARLLFVDWCGIYVLISLGNIVDVCDVAIGAILSMCVEGPHLNRFLSQCCHPTVVQILCELWESSAGAFIEEALSVLMQKMCSLDNAPFTPRGSFVNFLRNRLVQLRFEQNSVLLSLNIKSMLSYANVTVEKTAVTGDLAF